MDYEERKKILVHKTFKSMINILVIFLVPAVFMLLLGYFLQKKELVSFNITWYLLIFSFIFSWVLTIRMYQKISQEFRKLENEKDK